MKDIKKVILSKSDGIQRESKTEKESLERIKKKRLEGLIYDVLCQKEESRQNF